jgi:hypothetical protein
VTELPDLPEPEPGSTEHLDRLALEMVAATEELIPVLEAAGKHERAQRYRLGVELLRAVALADTDTQLAALERLDALLWSDQDRHPPDTEHH